MTAVLDTAGASFEHLVKVTIFVTDMSQFPELNDLYETYVSKPFPARSVVAVSQLPKGASIEVVGVGYRP